MTMTMKIFQCLLLIAIVLTTLPFVSSLSTTATAKTAITGLSSPPSLPLQPPATTNNIFVNVRSQFQRNDLKRKLISATKQKDKDESLIFSLVEELSKFNPTDCPTQGLAGYNEEVGRGGKSSPLDGSWRLLYTNAKDAEAPARTEKDSSEKFGDTVKSGIEVSTGQVIDAMKGECVNFIALEGTTSGDDEEESNNKKPFDRIEITIKMTPLNDTRVRLDFLRGRALNSNAPFSFLRDFTFSFPPAVVGDILATIRGKDFRVEPQAYFDILYIDDQLRAHRTGEGKIFIQERA
ncbi:hypothetical protein FRACYDRAFT_264253 [Fragilariopsis cylindrus CCMP1102]|uniref:Plastid lipid-associated protein/fibrillin conserved domain-containing protein n=1 Tax=Fragilariopsis cylindrus CCMP1102 TaxID=635003 RepID=A0A1E7ETR7_9STRA|nr:hypothetical protein FRACYDRAFT_264253 [Fragilariopsis cylindrus CCMP1102]|eukprot:OEU09225.1 hypothetical protein FRACYDRAFT_264253 [Fragilariopsis cylindrus CCMP1102]